MHWFDPSLNDSIDPNLLATERFWGDYFFEYDPNDKDGRMNNFFLTETALHARYAVPHIRNIAAFMT